MGAALAIVTAPHDPTAATSSALLLLNSKKDSAQHYHAMELEDIKQQQHHQQQYNNNNNNNNNNVCWWDPLSLFDSCKPEQHSSQHHTHSNSSSKNAPLLGWLRWILPPHSKEWHEQQQQLKLFQQQQEQQQQQQHWWRHHVRRWFSWLDPQLLHLNGDTLTGLIDKVLTSTLRLLLITNWLMALTVLLHTAVADWFLGDLLHRSNGGAGGTNTGATGAGATATNPTPPTTTTSRERMGGFLIFKLLLISAVVAPDTVDLMILLSWYTVLSFLRSLVALGAQQTEAAASPPLTAVVVPTPPSPGVWKLLAFCLGLDAAAAAVCVGLFHGAGTGMVLLLTGDCALLAVDCATHLVQHVQLHWDCQQARQLQ